MDKKFIFNKCLSPIQRLSHSDIYPSISHLRQRKHKTVRLLVSTAACLIFVFLIGCVWAEVTVRSLDVTEKQLSIQSRVLEVATVAMEDGNFYQHTGIDWQAVRRALEVNVRAGRIEQGGSTITQQLAKKLFLNDDRTAIRKVLEAFLAFALERRFSKAQILALYVHVIPYGMGQVGVENASNFYFGKSSDRLTLGEAALLVSLVPRNPTALPKPQSLQHGREVALQRIAFWFPGQFTDDALEDALQERVSIRSKALQAQAPPLEYAH